jgi:uroporphyrinogen-III synthase
MNELTGRRIAITRAPHQTAEFERLLRERGAEPLLYPCIDIAPPENSESLDNALRDAANGEFDWLMLTSGNTVHAIAQRLAALELSLSGAALKVAAVGPATAEAARDSLGLAVSVMPEVHTAEELAAVIQPVSGARILLPQSTLADDSLAQALTAGGARVTVVEAYRTVTGGGGVNLPQLLVSGMVDAVTFTSPSTVRGLLLRFEAEGGDVALLEKTQIACIGTKTADAARQQGLKVDIVPDEHTVSALVAALEAHFRAVE